MGYNLPEGNNHYLDDCDMICQECERKDDVDNGEYHNHRWYCKDCYDRLFKECPKCHISIISTDEELCEDCLAEKTYDESAQGMFEKLGYKKDETKITINGLVEEHTIDYIKVEDKHTYDITHKFKFYLLRKEYTHYTKLKSFNIQSTVTIEELKAVIQFYKELGWL